jgi:hypothetical protein
MERRLMAMTAMGTRQWPGGFQKVFHTVLVGSFFQNGGFCRDFVEFLAVPLPS